MTADWRELARRLEEDIGLLLDPATIREAGGGCINETWRARAEGGVPLFIKRHRRQRHEMLAAETAALTEIAATGTVRVPRPFWHGAAGESAFLVMEGLDLISRQDAPSQAAMGRCLAELHRHQSADGRHGWHRDNTIGETPQPNGWDENWTRFYGEQRLGHQFELARKRGRRFRGGEALIRRLPELLAGHRPEPSLLHGDLWGGNAAFLETGEPVLFDPASYYGDRETDLALSELFGGFQPAFYEGYRERWPLAAGYRERRALYQLYHLLNHDHLFGGAYAIRAQGMIDHLLASP